MPLLPTKAPPTPIPPTNVLPTPMPPTEAPPTTKPTLLPTVKPPSTPAEAPMPVPPTQAPPTPETRTIADIFTSRNRFEHSVQFCKDAGLLPALDGTGPLTLFAPTDETFTLSGFARGYFGGND
jgi:hypothetical protein